MRHRTTPTETARVTYPHCDTRVLHAPTECRFCDLHPDWQELRHTWNIAYTGHPPGPGQTACPAERARTLTSINHWAGNTPQPAGITISHNPARYEVVVTAERFEALTEETRRLLLDLQAKLV